MDAESKPHRYVVAGTIPSSSCRRAEFLAVACSSAPSSAQTRELPLIGADKAVGGRAGGRRKGGGGAIVWGSDHLSCLVFLWQAQQP